MIDPMIDLGKWNELQIIGRGDYGLFLDGGEEGSILLPRRYVTAEMREGEEIRVFVYTDSEDRLVATTETPLVEVGQFAWLEVLSVDERAGAFLDWGLSKDLLLPFREQGTRRVFAGDGVVVAVYVDPHTRRIVATTRLQRHFSQDIPDYETNDAVQALVYGSSPLGYKVIVDKRYCGLLYHAETTDKLLPGDQFTGYIKKVRSGGKLDVWRDPSGYERVESVTAVILQKLTEAGGKLPFHDKSPPERIRQVFNTSKKAFKQALGSLLKQGKIRFTQTGIEQVD